MLTKMTAFLARAPALQGLSLTVGDVGPAPYTAGLWCRGITVLDRRENLLGRIACLKFFNVYGPNEYHKGDMRSVACKAFHEISATGRLRLFRSNTPDFADGGQMRDFVYVKDCVELMFWLLENPATNGILNVGTGKARSWNDLACAIFAALGKEPHIEYMDMPEALRGKYQNFTQADMSWMQEKGCPLAFASIEQGIADYVNSYLSQGDPYLEMLS